MQQKKKLNQLPFPKTKSYNGETYYLELVSNNIGYYGLRNGDEDALLVRANGDIISDNYLATQAIIDDTLKAYKTGDYTYMSTTAKYGARMSLNE